MHSVGDREGYWLYCQSVASVTWSCDDVEAHMATYSLFATDHQWQVAHRQYKF